MNEARVMMLLEEIGRANIMIMLLWILSVFAFGWLILKYEKQYTMITYLYNKAIEEDIKEELNNGL